MEAMGHCLESAWYQQPVLTIHSSSQEESCTLDEMAMGGSGTNVTFFHCFREGFGCRSWGSSVGGQYTFGKGWLHHFSVSSESHWRNEMLLSEEHLRLRTLNHGALVKQWFKGCSSHVCGCRLGLGVTWSSSAGVTTVRYVTLLSRKSAWTRCLFF